MIIHNRHATLQYNAATVLQRTDPSDFRSSFPAIFCIKCSEVTRPISRDVARL